MAKTTTSLESSEPSILSLEDTTFDISQNSGYDDGTLNLESRLQNRAELDKLGLFSYAFCVICQEVIMPKDKAPVFCNICQTAVYCKPCIQQWS